MLQMAVLVDPGTLSSAFRPPCAGLLSEAKVGGLERRTPKRPPPRLMKPCVFGISLSLPRACRRPLGWRETFLPPQVLWRRSDPELLHELDVVRQCPKDAR